jgi:hypothetical protein
LRFGLQAPVLRAVVAAPPLCKALYVKPVVAARPAWAAWAKPFGPIINTGQTTVWFTKAHAFYKVFWAALVSLCALSRRVQKSVCAVCALCSVCSVCALCSVCSVCALWALWALWALCRHRRSILEREKSSRASEVPGVTGLFYKTRSSSQSPGVTGLFYKTRSPRRRSSDGKIEIPHQRGE